MNAFQLCVNCNAAAGYPHSEDCPRPKYRGDPDPGSPNWEAFRDQVYLDVHEEIGEGTVDLGCGD